MCEDGVFRSSDLGYDQVDFCVSSELKDDSGIWMSKIRHVMYTPSVPSMYTLASNNLGLGRSS